MRHEVEAKTHKLAIDQTNVDLLQTVQEQRDSLLKDLARSREDIEALQMQVDLEVDLSLIDNQPSKISQKSSIGKSISSNLTQELKIREKI